MSAGSTGLTQSSPCFSIEMVLNRIIMVVKATRSAYFACGSDEHLIYVDDRELTKAVEPYIKQEDEGKFRCKTCQKLFKATSFVEKHIANKHPELVKQLDEVQLSSFA